MSAQALSRHAPRADIALWRRILVSDTALLVGLALVKLVAHLLVAGNYGYFRDELYYIDAGRHLAPGYVDFPPFVAVLAAITRLFSGDALVALHIWPAVAGALLVLLTGLMARELGGGRFAQGLAALATLVTLTFLVLDSLFTMDAWDELWWALAAYVWIRLIRRNQPRLWLLFGLVAGIGLFTKLTMLAFGFALTIGLLLTPGRTDLRSRWPWLGAAIALLFLLPYLLWNAANGWPTPQFWSNYGHHTTQVSPLDFFVEQSYTMTPLTLPLWLAGLWYLFFSSQGKPYRALGWAFLVLYMLFSAAQAKSYFLSPAYPMLFAAGAIVFERGLRGSWRWVRPVYVALLLLSGLVLAPAALPVLPPATYSHVYGFLGSNAGAKEEQHTLGQLPQWLADRLGWPGMTATVARVYDRLPPDQRRVACIFTLNYGEAGAIDFFGPAYHLPHAISGHNTYWLWGPGSCTGTVVITVGFPRGFAAQSYRSVTWAATITCRYCMPEESGVPVYVARQPKVPPRDLWPSVKHYD